MDLVTPRRLDVWIGVLLFVLGFALCAMVLLGRRDGMALVHDEVAYLFQARTFAEGHLYMPSPPLPEFFEAAHLIVVPRMMAKYFPGHALLLAPFVRFPWVLPLLLLGASTTLIYVAARASGFGQLASMAGAVAFAGSGMNLQASASYFSQTTSTFSAAAGLAFAALLRQTGRARWGAGFGAAAGLALLIRPFDGLALGAAGVAMPRAWNRRTLAPAAGTFIVCGFLLLGFCKATTGSWTTTPWSVYARQYTPWDGLGIGPIDARPPERAFPPQLRLMEAAFRESREHYTWSVVPLMALARLKALLDYLPGFGALALLLLGLWSGRMAVPLAYAALLFLLQMTFHFENTWYLQELWPPLAIGVAAGADRLIRLRQSAQPRMQRLVWTGVIEVAFLLLAAGCIRDVAKVQPVALYFLRNMRAADRALQPARDARGLVFVRYSRLFGQLPLTNDEPDLERAKALLVLDLGPRNAELRKLFPHRPAFLYDARTEELIKLP